MGVGLAEIILLTVLTLGGGSLAHSQPLLWLASSVTLSSAPTAAGAVWLLVGRAAPAPVSMPMPHHTLPPPVPVPPLPPQIPTP
jgi:hypothetical protein